jgi:hypothetical protein
VTGVVLVAWIGLAAWRPSSTFHLAPTIAAAAWPVLLRRGPVRVAPIDAGRAALVAGILAMAVGGALAAADLLRGPTFWDSRHAIVEVPIAAIVGAYGGYRFARCGVAGNPGSHDVTDR